METKIMKKLCFILVIFFIALNLFGQEVTTKKISEYQMGTSQEGIYLRRYEEVAPADDITKNYLIFNTNGDLCIYQADTSRMIYLNKDFKIYNEVIMNLLIGPYDCMYTNNHLLMSDKSGRIYLFDSELKRKAYFETFGVFNTDNTGIWLSETYYDESSDILFFRDTKQNLYSIVHPSLNDDENRKNYKNPEKTLELFSSDYDMKHLGLYKGKYLTVDGQVYYWAGTTINHINYQIYDNKEVDIWNDDELEIKCASPNEQIESIAIHPSGDIYILRINWQTNTHNLYYIENTWDPEWREQWYDEHPEAIKP